MIKIALVAFGNLQRYIQIKNNKYFPVVENSLWLAIKLESTPLLSASKIIKDL